MKKTFAVLGMMCAGCAASVEKKLKTTEGVTDAAVNLPARTVLVEYDEHRTSPEQLQASLAQVGYDLVVEQDRNVEAIERRSWQRLLRQTLLSWGHVGGNGVYSDGKPQYGKPNDARHRAAQSVLLRTELLL